MIDPLCSRCEHELSKVHPPSPPHPKLSLGFLYHLALNFQFAFQSIALLTDFATNHSCSELDIRILKTADPDASELTKQSYDECMVEVEMGSKGMPREDVEMLANAHYGRVVDGMELVLSIFGIGKTGVLMSRGGGVMTVAMFSVDDRVNPNYYREQAALFYVEDIETKAVRSLNGTFMRKIIKQGLRIYHPNPDKILQCKDDTIKIVIFHPKIFVTNTKIMVYEIRESNLGCDIDTHYNSEKIQFLNKLGYEMSIHSQFRLSCYFSCLYLNNRLSITIGESQQPICKATYCDYLRTLLQNGALVRIKPEKLPGVLQMELYQTTDKYIMQNNGVLMYWKGRLINRFETEFGRMIQEKFYKKKYRSPPVNIWDILGVLEVDHEEICPNLLKTKFKNNTEYRRLIKDFSIMLEGIERKKNEESKNLYDVNDSGEHMRKIVKRSKEEQMYVD